MPVFGWLHHKHFVAKGTKNYKRHIHVWGGRVLLVLGVITGGTGLKLADNTTGGDIAYGVVAGLVIVAYAGVWFWSKRQAKTKTENTGSQGNDIEMKAS